jgi:crotonobetaine/carnitine-CoA ligase
VAVWLASTQLGAVIVPLDPRATSGEVERFTGIVEPALMIVGRRNADDLSDARIAAQCVVLDEEDPEVGWPAPPKVIDSRRDGHALVADVQPHDPAAVLFTSGTTSAPKGAIITQANYCYVGDVMSAVASVRPDDRMLVVLPLFHANAQYYSFCAAIAAGASVALTSRFSATRFLLQAQRLEATCASLFAAPIRMVLAKAERPATPLKLRHTWYAQNVSAAQYEEFAELIGCRPRQLYGMTETVVAVTTSDAVAPQVGSIGRQTIGATVALRSADTGSSVPVGHTGEIMVRGEPGREIFGGYLGHGSPVEGDWFHTGDFARVDENGNFWFVGRQSDVLKVSGENVSTVEVESVVSEHPLVHEAAVIGKPDAIRDEVPIAYVVPLSDAAPTAEELDAWCRERLAPSKLPREFHFVTELPRTSVGKIKKYQLSK